jgi:methionine synthase II (cobalamin-independent)
MTSIEAESAGQRKSPRGTQRAPSASQSDLLENSAAEKMLMPGVVSHAINLVEHSVLVADRIRATPRSSAARTSLRARIAADLVARIGR